MGQPDGKESEQSMPTHARDLGPGSVMNYLLGVVFAVCIGFSDCNPALARDSISGRSIIQYDSIHHPVIARRGMVVAQNEIAATIGAEILQAGGNAIDAAIATGLALAVTLPRAGNIGGSGFMLIYLADEDRTIALDFYSEAPAAADRDAFRDEQGNVDRFRRYSYLGPAVPGTVAGFDHALTEYGTMTWEEVAGPAIELARNGIVVTDDLHYAISTKEEILRRDPATRSLYIKDDGTFYGPGEILRMPELANTLQLIAERGASEFYRGSIGQSIADAMAANGGFIRKNDLAVYRVVEREPIWCSYRGYKYALMTPPSAGVYICELLNIIENFEIREIGAQNADLYHVLAESMKIVFSDRSRYTGGTPQYEMPVARLTNKDYAKRLADTIRADTVKRDAMIGAGLPVMLEESRDTTHYSIADRYGNVVANTYTLGSSFGSGVTVPGTGILLNDHIANFALSAGVPGATGFQANPNNRLEQGKRAVSTISPVIVFKDDAPFLVTGSPGGTRIITALTQLIISIIDHHMNIAQATATPRIHQEWNTEEGRKLEMEVGHSIDTINRLNNLGHEVHEASAIGSTQSILIKDGVFHGAADPRRPGAVVIGVN